MGALGGLLQPGRRGQAPPVAPPLLRSRAFEASDELLLESCRQGSEAAFAVLVRRHEAELVRHCTRIVGEASARDAAQDAFLTAWSEIRAGAEVRSLRPWLFTIAHRKALAQLRTRRRAAEAELPESLSDGVSPADQAQRDASVRDIFAALAALPAAQREAFVGVAVQGRSGRQIARQLGISECSARALVFRARAALRASAAICLTPPLAALRWLRGLLGARGAAPSAAGWGQATVGAKLGAVAIASFTAAGAGAIGLAAAAGGSGQHAPRRAAAAPRQLGAATQARLGTSVRTGAGERSAGLPAVSVHDPSRLRRVPATAVPSRRGRNGEPAAGAATPPAAGAVAGAQAAATVSVSRGGSSSLGTGDPAGLAGDAAAVTHTGAGTVASTVSAAGDAVHALVTKTGGAVKKVTGALADAATSLTSPAASGPVAAVTQPATAAAQSAVSSATQAAGDTADAAATAVGGTVAAASSAAAGATSAVADGATGAVGVVVGLLRPAP